jgi:flagellar basal-body rod protein FlgB
MIEALFNQTNYVAAKKMLEVTAMRHEAIASNIANLETPGYKRIDVHPSFKEQLSQAMTDKNSAQIAQLRPALTVDTSSMGSSKDGNTVQLEDELLELNQNTLSHTFETQVITGNLMKLRLAITGRG